MKCMPAIAALALSVTTTTVVATPDSCSGGESRDIVETAVSAGHFKTLVAALEAADLVDALKGKGLLTVFAPTDEAFAKLPDHTLQSLLKPENKGTLAAILTYHLVPGRLDAGKALGLSDVSSLNGQRLEFQLDDGSLQVDRATVISTDLFCRNGVIHVIDEVMLPSSKDIVDTASSVGTFNTLLAAAKAAGLGEVLKGDDPLTIFAPTDAAFEKLPAGTVESLLKKENRHDLIAVLKYHILPGRVYARDAVSAQSAKTVQGSRVRISVDQGRLLVNNAIIGGTDIDTTNGVIHVIDKVLLPSS